MGFWDARISMRWLGLGFSGGFLGAFGGGVCLLSFPLGINLGLSIGLGPFVMLNHI